MEILSRETLTLISHPQVRAAIEAAVHSRRPVTVRVDGHEWIVRLVLAAHETPEAP